MMNKNGMKAGSSGGGVEGYGCSRVAEEVYDVWNSL